MEKKPSQFEVASDVNNVATRDRTIRAKYRDKEAMYPDTLDLQEAAAVLHCHPKTLRILAKTAKVPGKKVGRIWRFSERKLKEWLEAS